MHRWPTRLPLFAAPEFLIVRVPSPVDPRCLDFLAVFEERPDVATCYHRRAETGCISLVSALLSSGNEGG